MGQFAVTFPENPMNSLTEEHPRYDLAESYGPHLTFEGLLAAAGHPDLGPLMLAYGSSAGDPRLRARIAAVQGVEAGEVLTTLGSMHALFLLSSVLGRDSEVVTTSPVFPLARNALEAAQARIHEVPLAFEEGYRLSPEAVASRLTSRTRLVSLATPQNPTGVASTRTDLAAILSEMARVCPEAYLLVDETYREASFGEDPVAPSAIDLDARVITCAALSKCHGAPGLRVGWLITRDPSLYAQLESGKATTIISLPPLNEALAAALLDRQAILLAERRHALGVNLEVTARWVDAHADLIEWVRPDAGALCCARLKPERVSAALMPQFHEQLRREGVRVSRGEWFRQPEHVFRLGFGYLPPDELKTALNIVASVAGNLTAR